MAKYQGIERGKALKASYIVSALDSKMSLTGDETIYGTKTFTTSPLVPEKPEAGTDTPAGNNTTAIATEAQVYKMEDSVKKQIEKIISDHKTNVDNLLSNKASLTGDEAIDGEKTFAQAPLLAVPGKSAAVVEADTNSTAIATEAQVVKTVNGMFTSAQTVSGKWTFNPVYNKTAPVVPGKNTEVAEADTNSTAIATEAQVYKTLMCW
jgi:hypothetical protein